MEWLTRVSDRVTSVVPRVDVIRPSPDGSLLAVFASREWDPDLARRERVYVIERATGREVVALDGPQTFRALAWASEDALLVLRDHDAGGSRVTLHAIPDGGVVTETHLAECGSGLMALDVTVDHRRAFVSPIWHSGKRRRPYAAVLALPSLTTLLRIDPQQFGDPSAPSVASLSPEGTQVVVVIQPKVSVLTVDRSDVKPQTHPLSERQRSPSTVMWVARDRAWVTTTDDTKILDKRRHYAVDTTQGAWTVLFTEDRSADFPYALRVDGDGRRVACISLLRGAGTPNTDTTRLVIADARTAEVMSARPLKAYLLSVCWTRDDANIVSVSKGAGSLEIHRWPAEGGAPDLLTSLSFEDQARNGVEVACVGDDTAMVLEKDFKGGAFVSLISLRP
ncbi:MAG: hypothetical protein R3A52_09650 [Polyangiales bacterium]